jgi:hypothetical protein
MADLEEFPDYPIPIDAGKSYIVSRNHEIIGDYNFGEITLFFTDGILERGKGNETGQLKGNGTRIVAPIKQIFDCDIDFENSSWNIERAYPQWFGAVNCAEKLLAVNNLSSSAETEKELISAAIDNMVDSSDAINNAIKLKKHGEVFLPRGFYKISKFINVTNGIQLVGEGCDFEGFVKYGSILFPWNMNPPIYDSKGIKYNNINEFRDTFFKKEGEKVDYNADRRKRLLTDIDFPICPEHVSWRKETQTVYRNFGYMIVVNLEAECEIDFNGEEPYYIIYSWERKFPPYSTKISNLGLTTINSDEYGNMRGILFEGCVELSGIRGYGLSQLCFSVGRSYADGKTVKNCGLSIVDEFEYSKLPGKLYAFDIRGLGDSLLFCNNHVPAKNDIVGSLFIKGCNGGTVTGNILNSDIQIEGCKALTFANNHCEYGITMEICDSAVSLSDNFFWLGTRPCIKLRRLQFPVTTYSSVIELRNNLFIYYDSTSSYEVADYEIITDGYALINITNCFRVKGYNDIAAGDYFGIRIGKFYLLTSDDGNYVYESPGMVYASLEQFNDLSHINSCSSIINQVKVQTPVFTINKADLLNLVISHPNEYNVYTWFGTNENAKYDYTFFVLSDSKRKILLRFMNISGVSAKDNHRDTDSGEYSDIMFSCDNVHTSALSDNFHYASKNMMLYIIRRDTGAKTTNCILLPFCGASKLYDNYNSICGFKWVSGDTLGVLNTCIESVRNIGENVECLGTGAPAQGNWTEGDTVRKIGTNSDGGYWIYIGGTWHYK